MRMTDEVYRLSDTLMRLDRAYERYAKSLGLNYTGLYLLHILYLSKTATQKQICEQMMLPKQTINSTVMSFQKQGLLEMVELPEDRRHKAIRLTDAGEAYAEQVLPTIMEAESHSMTQFTAGERETLFDLLERYTQAFSKELQQKG